jgi:hypothetical protein
VNTVPHSGKRGMGPNVTNAIPDDDGPVVVTKTVNWAAAPVGVMEAGDTVHTACVGAPVHVSVTVELKPLAAANASI